MSLAFFKAKNKDQSFTGKTEYVFFAATGTMLLPAEHRLSEGSHVIIKYC